MTLQTQLQLKFYDADSARRADKARKGLPLEAATCRYDGSKAPGVMVWSFESREG